MSGLSENWATLWEALAGECGALVFGPGVRFWCAALVLAPGVRVRLWCSISAWSYMRRTQSLLSSNRADTSTLLPRTVTATTVAAGMEEIGAVVALQPLSAQTPLQVECPQEHPPKRW